MAACRFILSAGLCALLLPALTGCSDTKNTGTPGKRSAFGGDTHASLKLEAIQVFNEMTTALKQIKDEASLKKTRPKVDSLLDRLEDIAKRSRALPFPYGAEGKRLFDEYAPKTREATGPLNGETIRVSLIPGGREMIERVNNKVNRAVTLD